MTLSTRCKVWLPVIPIFNILGLGQSQISV
jgi:hypothetical protein